MGTYRAVEEDGQALIDDLRGPCQAEMWIRKSEDTYDIAQQEDLVSAVSILFCVGCERGDVRRGPNACDVRADVGLRYGR